MGLRKRLNFQHYDGSNCKELQDGNNRGSEINKVLVEKNQIGFERKRERGPVVAQRPVLEAWWLAFEQLPFKSESGNQIFGFGFDFGFSDTQKTGNGVSERERDFQNVCCLNLQTFWSLRGDTCLFFFFFSEVEFQFIYQFLF